MPDSNGAKIALQVSADNTYSWKLDGEDQGQITAAAGTKQVMTPAGKHEIVARSPDGKTRFDRIFTVGSGKANAIRIIGKAAAPSASPSTAATKAPSPAPASPVTPTPRQLPQQLPQQQPPPVRERPQFPTAPATQPGSLGNPDMFVRIQLYASKGSAKTRPYSPAGASPASSDWQVMVSVVPIWGTYYDVKLQVVMKDVGDGGTSVELADSQPGPVRNLYMTRAEALGKEAVVCYTARAASQQAQRWTGTFKADIRDGLPLSRRTSRRLNQRAMPRVVV
jgi:hypothetical protein